MIKKEIILKSFLSERQDILEKQKTMAVMEKVDNEGDIIGFSILKVSALVKKPLSVRLKSHVS